MRTSSAARTKCKLPLGLGLVPAADDRDRDPRRRDRQNRYARARPVWTRRGRTPIRARQQGSSGRARAGSTRDRALPRSRRGARRRLRARLVQRLRHADPHRLHVESDGRGDGLPVLQRRPDVGPATDLLHPRLWSPCPQRTESSSSRRSSGSSTVRTRTRPWFRRRRACSGCRCTSSSRGWASTSRTPGSGKQTRLGYGRVESRRQLTLKPKRSAGRPRPPCRSRR